MKPNGEWTVPEVRRWPISATRARLLPRNYLMVAGLSLLGGSGDLPGHMAGRVHWRRARMRWTVDRAGRLRWQNRATLIRNDEANRGNLGGAAKKQFASGIPFLLVVADSRLIHPVLGETIDLF